MSEKLSDAEQESAQSVAEKAKEVIDALPSNATEEEVAVALLGLVKKIKTGSKEAFTDKGKEITSAELLEEMNDFYKNETRV